MNNHDFVTCCTDCGQAIKTVVMIGGLPYGTTCAQNKLGIRQFPSWFSGGDWDAEKIKHDREVEEVQSDLRREYELSREFTSNAWNEWKLISSVHQIGYVNSNDWLCEFTCSILTRLGYSNVLCSQYFKYEKFEDAERIENLDFSNFPYLRKEAKKIETLSDKQQSILHKYTK